MLDCRHVGGYSTRRAAKRRGLDPPRWGIISLTIQAVSPMIRLRVSHATSALSAKFFHDEAAAFAGWRACFGLKPDLSALRRLRAYQHRQAEPEKKVRMGLKSCGQCRKQFTVTVGPCLSAAM